MKKTTFFKSKVLAFWLSLIMTVGIVVPVFAFSACPQREEEPLFALSSNATNRIFESEADRFALPRIITFEQDYTVSWAAVSNSIPSNPVAFLCESDTYSIGLIGAAHNTSRATTTFAATITSPNHPDAYTLNYTVSVTNISTDQLTHISSTKHGNINYTTRGIAQTRVFGLYDIVLPDCGTASPGHFEGEQWVDGTWRDVSFARSSSSFELLWNYRGQVNLDVWAEQRQADGTFIRITEANFSQSTSVARVIYDSEVSNSAIKVDFYNAGTVRIVAESAGQIRPGFRPRFEYIYNIVDAVNVYDFEDIKLLERIARYTYISDGIRGDDGQFLTRVNGTQLAGAAAFGRSLGHYIDIANYDGLLSLHFNTTATPTPNVMATPLQYRWDGFDDTGHFFDEFIHWSPAFRFKDIVLRSTHLDRTEAAIANGTMQSWAEGTWFFGSVFGNGFGIDASNYTQSTAGVYRNTHSMRGLDDGSSLGFEGRRFFPGYGWGETFAFYTLANNSIIDNIVLTGEEIPQGTTAIRLNQYSKLGVLGTSMLQGRDRPFSQGQTHDNGIFKDGQFIQGITVQNSVLEKGLTLLGFGYAPNADKPLSVLSSVFRFAGFTGVLGLSFGGGIGDADPENGEAVRTVAPEHSLSIRDNQRILHPQAAGSFGNFIVARNNIFHDISVSPFLTMPSRSGSHISIEGEQNYFFSWLRSNDIQFPEMPNPLHEGFARIMGGSINGMIPALMNRVFTNNNNQGPPAAGRGHSFPQGRTWHQTLEARYEQPNGVFLINVPVIIVTDEGQTKNNFVTFDHALLNPALITAAGLVSDHAGTNTPRDLNQRFDLLMLRSPLNAEPSLQNHLIRVSDMNSVGINRRIASIVPAGQNVPTIASGSVINFLEGADTGGTVVLNRVGSASLNNHRIQYNGQRINSVYDSESGTVSIQIEDLVRAGINRFGVYSLELINIGQRSLEPVSRFSVIVQGSNGGLPQNVTAGMDGFAEQNRFVDFSINLPIGDTVSGVTVLGSDEFPQSTPINFEFIDQNLRLVGADLRNGVNHILVLTNSISLILNIEVVNYPLYLEAMAVDLNTNPPFIINLIGNISRQDLTVSIDNIQLNQGQFSILNNSIIVTNAVLRQILGDNYAPNFSAPVTVTNAVGLNLTTTLQIINHRQFFNFSTNAVSTPHNNASGIGQPFINLSPTHRHFGDIFVEIANHAGDNILGVSFVDTDNEALARAGMIRYNQGHGFATDRLPNGNTRVTVPALAAVRAGLVAGQQYRIWVFSSLSAARSPNIDNQMLLIFDGGFDDGLNRATRFVSDSFFVRLDPNIMPDTDEQYQNNENEGETITHSGIQLGLAAGNFAFLHDLFISQTPTEFDVPDDIPLIGGTTIPLPPIDIADHIDFSHSSFSDGGAVLAIRNQAGQVLFSFTRDQIFEGNEYVSFLLANGGTRAEPRWLTTSINIPLIGPVVLPIDIPPIDAFYVSGLDFSHTLLLALGQGTFVIEFINNFNISYTILTIA